MDREDQIRDYKGPEMVIARHPLSGLESSRLKQESLHNLKYSIASGIQLLMHLSKLMYQENKQLKS